MGFSRGVTRFESEVLSKGESKGSIRFVYRDINPLTADFDGYSINHKNDWLSASKMGGLKIVFISDEGKGRKWFSKHIILQLFRII
ncbi:hypothetical protein ACYSNM_08655 [Myroides sp. LJL116]